MSLLVIVTIHMNDNKIMPDSYRHKFTIIHALVRICDGYQLSPRKTNRLSQEYIS